MIDMVEILARCGYRCDLCPAYYENVREDADRQRTSDGWHRYFGFQVAPEEIGCRGCSPDCLDKGCPVRPCAEAKGIADCALCADFPCPKIESRMEFIPNFLAERKDLVIPPEDYQRFLKPYESKEGLLKRHGARERGR